MAGSRPLRSLVLALAVASALACAVVGAPPAASADSTFIVNGRGWGHGIGMSQYGAKGYADQGWSYSKIMAWYFQSTKLDTRPNLTVKVDLDHAKGARSSWRIASGGGSMLTVSALTSPTVVATVAAGVNVWITFDAKGAVLRADHYDSKTKVHSASTVLKVFGGTAIASTGSQSSSSVRILTASGPFSQTGIVWRGTLRFSRTSTTVGHATDYVYMEDYLRGVVPRESPSSWPVEALRAQAVAARSYAYGAASSGSVLYCTTSSQVYNGAGDGSSSHETQRTDDAVAQTAGQVVVYGSQVVQTYFSSSSGGRTANSKDVWFSSAGDNVSPVYYTSVVDADQGSPNYRWPTTTISGTSLASKVRSHYSGSAQPSPATVTGVTLQPGTSGFVRYVTLKWSNGKSTTLKGTQVQSALGMKSSAFTIVKKAPPAPALTRFQETDKRLVRTGTWTVGRSTKLSGGAYLAASKAGAQMTACFKGTAVAWIGTKASTFGKADVYFDGKRITTVDLYSVSTVNQKSLWSRSGLSADTTHTLLIKVLGTRSSAARGTNVAVDAIGVAGSLLQAPKPPSWLRTEESSAAVAYKGTWTKASSSQSSAGAFRYAYSASAVATFTFTGSRVKWVARFGPGYGQAKVSLDGKAAVVVDLYSSSYLYQREAWDSGALTQGKHTLTVAPAGKKNARSRGYSVDIDAFDVLALTP